MYPFFFDLIHFTMKAFAVLVVGFGMQVLDIFRKGIRNQVIVTYQLNACTKKEYPA